MQDTACTSLRHPSPSRYLWVSICHYGEHVGALCLYFVYLSLAITIPYIQHFDFGMKPWTRVLLRHEGSPPTLQRSWLTEVLRSLQMSSHTVVLQVSGVHIVCETPLHNAN